MPASIPATTSVSVRSPTMTAFPECASRALSAERIINGLGLHTKYGATPVARLISAATEPVAAIELLVSSRKRRPSSRNPDGAARGGRGVAARRARGPPPRGCGSAT
jgi:hypothetical protein